MATNKHYIVQSFEPSQTITNEVHTVLDGKFLLDFIPDQLIRVSITGYTQIPWNNAITSATQFKVNYQNGEVQVHSSKEGVSITVTSYGAKGIIKYYADRIVLDNGETIQNKVSSLSSVIESIETADSNAQIGVYPLIASGTNTYTTSYTGLTYYDGLKISLTISAIQKNTGASTLNINSLGDRYIKYYDGNGNKQSLTGGELVGKVLLEYDGSEFLIVSNNAYLNAIKSELDAHKADYAILKTSVEQGKYTPEATEYADIFSLPSTVVQGVMKGKLKGNTDEDCISVQPQEILSRGKNLFDKSNITHDMILGANGVPSYTSGWYLSNFIPVKENTSYKFSALTDNIYSHVCLYDLNKTLVLALRNYDLVVNNLILSIPSGIKHIRFASDTSVDTLQLEQGTTATTYEPYQESKAYLKYPLRSVPNGTCDEVDLQSGKLTKRCEEYVLQASDIAGIIPYTELDYVQLNKPVDFVGYNNLNTDNACIIIPGFIGKDPIGWDDALNIGGFFNQSAALIAYLGVPKGTYANLAAAQAALVGTKIVYQLAEPQVIENALTNPLTVYPSGTVSNKAKKQYVLKAADIAGILSDTNIDRVRIAKPIDGLGFNDATLTFWSEIAGFEEKDLEYGVHDSVENIGFYSSRLIADEFNVIVAKGTYASLAEAQADLAGTIITYETKPELSTIPVTVHSEPINLAGAVKSESDRNTRQDEQINDITLLLDYLIVVNA